MVAKAQSGRGFARRISAKLAFLPDPVRLFLRRRAFELAGGVLIAAAAALALALTSYNSLDVSLNNASGQAPANLLGPAGATIAETSEASRVPVIAMNIAAQKFERPARSRFQVCVIDLRAAAPTHGKA